MNLNFKKLGTGQPVIILHGLFGSLDNWMTLSKKIAASFEVYILDARNHGFSPHHPEFNYEVMADDLYDFIQEHHLENPVILGHSMGGKTAMQFAMTYPDIPSKLIVVDIAPKHYPVHHNTILEGMFSLDFNQVNSRKMADEKLSNHIADLSTRQFILKNLYWKEKGVLDWKFNLSVINNNIEVIGSEIIGDRPFEKPTLFIRGEKSNYILESDYDQISGLFINARIESINAGHWVHAESPNEFLKITQAFL